MHVDHELPEGTCEPRETALQYDEPRAGEHCGSLEIHLPQCLAEIKMLLWRKAVIALGAEMVVLDIVARVFTVGHLRQRQGGNFRKRVVERPRDLFLESLCVRAFL